MQHNWYKSGWCHKVIALVIITSYFVLLIFIHDTTYIWATLALIIVLFVTTFSCTSTNSAILLQLRGTRVTGLVNRAHEEVQNDESQEPAETRIWMTDIPPSYSFVMADIPPQTPPPSYGSAILLFPPPYVVSEAKTEQETAEASAEEAQQQRRPMSISAQVSVSSVMPEVVQLGAISFSTQVSVISGTSELPPLKARFYISRQVSREDTADENSHRTENILTEVPAKLYLLARQGSKEDVAKETESCKPEQAKIDRRSLLSISRQLSREDGADGTDLHKQLLKHDLRRRVLLSRQASREEASNSESRRQEPQESDRMPLASREEVVDIADQKNGEIRDRIVQPECSFYDFERRSECQASDQIFANASIEIQTNGTVSITIPEDVGGDKDKNT